MDNTNALFDEILAELRKKNFYGTLEIHFQHGRIVHIKKHETMLVTDRQKLKQD